jgi:hypothetical protein
MTGYLTQTLGEWMVKHDKDEKLYPLCPDSQKWIDKNPTRKFLKEGIEVDFSLITTGEYNKEKESLVKEYSAKLLYINHETI